MSGVGLERLGWTDDALAAVAELRGWTPEAISRLDLIWDERAGQVVFPIRDATGDDLGELRYLPDPARRNGRRKMAQASGVPRQLFPPPETLGDEDRLLILAEGEPDAVAAWSAGFAAVAVPGVQGWKLEYGARFSGRRWKVIVCADCDDEGRAFAARAAGDLVEAGVDARIVDLDPNRADGYDLTDFLARESPDRLRELVEEAQAPVVPLADFAPSEPEPFTADPTVTLREFIDRRDETAAEPLIMTAQGSLLPAGGAAILAAKTGDGKTTFVVELVLHAAAGIDYLGLEFPHPLRALIIENEGPREAFREKLERRLARWTDNCEPVRIWDAPAEWGSVRVSDPRLRDQLRSIIESHEIDLVVADTLTRFGVRGNGTPEETREFVQWLTEVGLGRTVAFLLLHHPRTRPEPGEPELERVAGAWPPHADLILLLQKLAGDRARLSFPKARWANGQRPASILAFDAATESFEYLGDDEREERDYVADLAEIMAGGDWWTVNRLRRKRDDGGIGADPEPIKLALQDDRFESTEGDAIGRRKDATFYRLREASSASGDATDAPTLRSQRDEASSSSPIREGIGDDASSDRSGSVDADEIERLAERARTWESEAE